MAKTKKAKSRSSAKRAKRAKRHKQNTKNAAERRAHRELLGKAAGLNASELTSYITELKTELENAKDSELPQRMKDFEVDYLTERIALLQAELELLS